MDKLQENNVLFRRSFIVTGSVTLLYRAAGGGAVCTVCLLGGINHPDQ